MHWLRADSWTFRLWAALLGAVAAGGLLGIGLQLATSAAKDDQIILMLSCLGGAFGGYLMSGLIGRPGWLGAALTPLGCWLAGGLGGAFAGTVMAPVIGTVFGAALGAGLPGTSALVFAAWVLTCVALHFIIGFLRPIKDS